MRTLDLLSISNQNSVATVSPKAKRAMQRGATAVIFDTTDDLHAAEEVKTVISQPQMPIAAEFLKAYE